MTTRRFDPVEGRNAEIIETVMTCPEVEKLDDSQQFKVRLCVEEVEENILCYSGSTWVEVSVDRDDSQLAISFRDGGVAFDPLAQKDPDINADLMDREVGGLGIFLCKQMMDVVEYKRIGLDNLLTMKIKINLN